MEMEREMKQKGMEREMKQKGMEREMKWRESKDEEGKGKREVAKVGEKIIWKGDSMKEE